MVCMLIAMLMRWGGVEQGEKGRRDRDAGDGTVKGRGRGMDQAEGGRGRGKVLWEVIGRPFFHEQQCTHSSAVATLPVAVPHAPKVRLYKSACGGRRLWTGLWVTGWVAMFDSFGCLLVLWLGSLFLEESAAPTTVFGAMYL